MQDFRMETFLAVCRCMNYTKAAAALKLTQPAVSQHIRYLEQEYGVELFRKNGKKSGLQSGVQNCTEKIFNKISKMFHVKHVSRNYNA